MTSFDAARRMMVDGQIRTNDVTDRAVIAAFGKVPRERFVPEADTYSLSSTECRKCTISAVFFL